MTCKHLDNELRLELHSEMLYKALYLRFNSISFHDRVFSLPKQDNVIIVKYNTFTEVIYKMKDKPWWKSKTNIGALLVGLGNMSLVTGNYLQGVVDLSTFINSFVVSLGGVLTVVGLRYKLGEMTVPKSVKKVKK